MGKTRNYKEHLNDRLQDHELAAAYLDAAMEDDDVQVFLLALRDVAEAQGGLGWLAKETDLNRPSLYQTLSKRGNPRLSNLRVMLEAFGLRLSITPLTPEDSDRCAGPRP